MTVHIFVHDSSEVLYLWEESDLLVRVQVPLSLLSKNPLDTENPVFKGFFFV